MLANDLQYTVISYTAIEDVSGKWTHEKLTRVYSCISAKCKKKKKIKHHASPFQNSMFLHRKYSGIVYIYMVAQVH